MQTAKSKIEAVVKQYVRDYPDELKLVRRAVEMRRHMIRDKVNFEEGADMMPLFEISETLQTMIIMALDEAETVWFKTKQGGNWFVKKFPAFSLI